MGSIFMFKRKVSPEEKITAVESYLNGDRQHHTILEQYGIAKESFRTWVEIIRYLAGKALGINTGKQAIQHRHRRQQ